MNSQMDFEREMKSIQRWMYVFYICLALAVITQLASNYFEAKERKGRVSINANSTCNCVCATTETHQ